MRDELEKIDEITRRLGISYEEARFALEEAGGDIAEALVIAERDRETAGAGLAASGLAFMDELKEVVSGGEIRGVRLKFGNRLLKEFPVAPATALAALGVAILAVVVTKLRVEVDRAPAEPEALPESGYETE